MSNAAVANARQYRRLVRKRVHLNSSRLRPDELPGIPRYVELLSPAISLHYTSRSTNSVHEYRNLSRRRRQFVGHACQRRESFSIETTGVRSQPYPNSTRSELTTPWSLLEYPWLSLVLIGLAVLSLSESLTSSQCQLLGHNSLPDTQRRTSAQVRLWWLSFSSYWRSQLLLYDSRLGSSTDPNGVRMTI